MRPFSLLNGVTVFSYIPFKMTCDSHAEMRQLVTGFRDLQSKYGQ